MANNNYEIPFSSQEDQEASRLTARVGSMLGNTERSGQPACEYTGRGGTHTGPATHFVNFHGERGDQTTAVCAGHLTKIQENAARIARAGGPSIDSQISHKAITPEAGRAHQEKRAIEGVEVRLSMEEPLRGYYGNQKRGVEGQDVGNALWARENEEVGRPGPITDRERSGESDLKKDEGAVERVISSASLNGGRQPTPDLTAVDKFGRGLYVDKGPGYIRGGQWHPGGVTRIYRFEKEDTSPRTMEPEEVEKNRNELIETLASQAKAGARQPKNSKKDLESAPLGAGSGTMDEVIKTYKAGGDYKAHAASLGLSEGDVDFHIQRLGQKPVHGGRFVKGTNTNAWRNGGKIERNAPAVAVPVGSQEDVESRFDTRSPIEVAVQDIVEEQSRNEEIESKREESAKRLRRIEEFRKNFETGGSK